MKLNKKTKILVYGIICCSVIVCMVILVCNYLIINNSRGKVYSDVRALPHNKVGLLLGTNPVNKYGKPNPFFMTRIKAATTLYEQGKIDFILVSGDNSKKEYDEPESMKRALMKAGVPENRIYLDYAGFRTLDSVVRAKEVFGQNSITIISQRFHNERAIYLAEHNGISAIGYNAKDVTSRGYLKVTLREYLAKVKVFIDIATNKQPHFLGEKIEIKQQTF